MNNIEFNREEKHLIGQVSFLFAVRQLGISLILPFLSIYIMSMESVTETLAGIAFGIFSLSQTLLQIPLGKLSDRWGRKKTTILGLAVYGIGTIMSGFSFNIYHLIIARLITGAGAVKGVMMAWLTDGVKREKRNSALSFVGVAIGAVVILGFSVNSLIAGKIGIEYLFYISGVLFFTLIIFISTGLKDFQHKDEFSIDLKKENILTILKNSDLLRINILGFIEHFCFASTFFIMPVLIERTIDISAMWKINAPLGIIGTCFMFYFARRADRNGIRSSIDIAIMVGIAGVVFVILFDNVLSYAVGFILVYSSHCILQPILPAAVSRYPNSSVRGTAIGIFITFQSIGSSVGGVVGGWLHDHYEYCFYLLIILFLFSFVLTAGYRDFKEENNKK